MNFVELGKKIYRLDNPREAHRFVVFIARCMLHPQRMDRLEKFFSQSEFLKKISDAYPFFYEQATRAFFYYKSTFNERIELIESHINFLMQTFDENFLLKLYNGEKIELWKMPLDETLGELQLLLCVETGQRKESLMSLMLRLSDGTPIYQMMFWISKNTLWIGAMQGPNVEDSREVIKKITKKCHAYRTKNLILYATQIFARSIGLEKIFAVTNYGYYANNHVRIDRKLKTSFSDFWQECGGTLTDDKRFCELPLNEIRKSEEEIPVRKRAVYRRRFELLDKLNLTVTEKIQNFRKE